MTLFDVIKSIYEKKEINFEFDNGFLIVLMKWLSCDRRNINALLYINKFLFFIGPKHLYKLIFLYSVGGRQPFLQLNRTTDGILGRKNDERGNDLLCEISRTFRWSRRESELLKDILEKVIDKEYWSKEFGLK